MRVQGGAACGDPRHIQCEVGVLLFSAFTHKMKHAVSLILQPPKYGFIRIVIIFAVIPLVARTCPEVVPLHGFWNSGAVHPGQRAAVRKTFFQQLLVFFETVHQRLPARVMYRFGSRGHEGPPARAGGVHKIVLKRTLIEGRCMFWVTRLYIAAQLFECLRRQPSGRL